MADQVTDRTYYLIIADVILNGRHRVSVIEDTAELTTERQVADFVSRTDNVQRIIEVNPTEFSSRDVSEDIARLMVSDRSIELGEGDREFLETFLGCDVARQALAEAA